MPTFTYKAKSGPNKIVSGVISADNDQMAVNKLLELGHTPLEVKVQTAASPILSDNPRGSKPVSPRIPQTTVAIFTRQMGDMAEAGVPLLKSLDILMRQKQTIVMQKVIESLHDHVEDGGSFSDALALHPETFSMLYVNMVKSGELGGYLPQVLNRLADFIEKDLILRAQVKSSLLYPAIIFLVGLMTMFVLLTFVLPRLTVMFEDFDAALPLPTQIVIAFSGFFAHFWWLILLVVGAGGYLFNQWLHTPQGRMYVDGMTMKIPILREFLQNAQTALFARTLATLLESGVAISSALESVTATIQNVVLKGEMQRITQKVKEGKSLTVALKEGTFFSEIAVNMIAVGEESGKLDKSLHKLAVISERATTETAGTFVTILGPAVLVVVVAIVGFVIVAMLLPMFRMNMIIN